jgi:hypothetical protein
MMVHAGSLCHSMPMMSWCLHPFLKNNVLVPVVAEIPYVFFEAGDYFSAAYWHLHSHDHLHFMFRYYYYSSGHNFE